jgi:Protein of unknown function (DUF3575)
MKKIILFTICIFTIVISNAQTEKKNWMLGGSASFQSANSTSILILNPSAGYFFVENFAAGLNLSYTNISYSSSSASLLGFGPFVRGYFGNKSDGKFFGQVAFSLASSNSSSSSNSSASAFGLKLGYAKFLNKNIALEFSTGLESQSSTSVFLLGVGFQIHLK